MSIPRLVVLAGQFSHTHRNDKVPVWFICCACTCWMACVILISFTVQYGAGQIYLAMRDKKKLQHIFKIIFHIQFAGSTKSYTINMWTLPHIDDCRLGFLKGSSLVRALNI